MRLFKRMAKRISSGKAAATAGAPRTTSFFVALAFHSLFHQNSGQQI